MHECKTLLVVYISIWLCKFSEKSGEIIFLFKQDLWGQWGEGGNQRNKTEISLSSSLSFHTTTTEV